MKMNSTVPTAMGKTMTRTLSRLHASGVALVPEPSVGHYGLAKLPVARHLRSAAEEWPKDELYLVTHRALHNVPRVRVVWELLLARWGERAPKG